MLRAVYVCEWSRLLETLDVVRVKCICRPFVLFHVMLPTDHVVAGLNWVASTGLTFRLSGPI